MTLQRGRTAKNRPPPTTPTPPLAKNDRLKEGADKSQDAQGKMPSLSNIFGTLLRSNPAPAPVTQVFDRMPARHKELSIIASLDDACGQPTRRLLDLALAASARAKDIQLTELDRRDSGEKRWYRTWPGEHYLLLAALVAELQAKTVIEIGTFTGMGVLALAHFLPADGRLVTFDLTSWREFPQTWLVESDFADGRIRQELADIGRRDGINPYRSLFEEADLIFIDAPKDGITEQLFIDAIASVGLRGNPIVVFDDIRLVNMVEIWRRLDRPKLDLTSFGHWSGTGLVDWNGLSPAG
jgi:predicted O-methyltransferase YrrM